MIKAIDKASVDLIDIFHNGQSLNEIRFYFVKQNNLGDYDELLRIIIEDVKISRYNLVSISISGSNTVNFYEKYKLEFNVMKIRYDLDFEEATLLIYGNDRCCLMIN